MSDITHAICIKDFDDDDYTVLIKEGTVVEVKKIDGMIMGC